MSAALSIITCQQGQVYVAVTKKCLYWGDEESYKILSGSTVLVTSTTFADNEQRTDEYCLTASTNNQYTIKFIDSYGDSWASGAWASVSGQYGNTVFKNFMTDDDEDEFALSLYYPI